jgi:hypothetical protein
MVKRSLVGLGLAWALAAAGTALAAEPVSFAAGSEPGIAVFISKPLGRTGGAPVVGLRLERMGPTAAPAGNRTFSMRSVAELAVVRLDGEGDIDSSTESSVRLRPWVWASVIGMAAVLLILENNDDDDDVPAYEIPRSSGPG